MKQWLSVSIVLAVSSMSAHAVDDSSIQFAILAEDVSPESRALAKFLTADLTKVDGVGMVERTDIGRVLAEQKLTAGGLVDTDSRVQGSDCAWGGCKCRGLGWGDDALKDRRP